MSPEIISDIYYVGVNDRRTDLFENMIPLRRGVSYNAYLLLDEKNALIDSVELNFSDVFIEKLLALLQGRTLDYLVVNHMEPDHSGSIKILRQYFPAMQIIGNAWTSKMIAGYYGITEGVVEVKEGQELSLGSKTLRFYLTPMIHWPETMMTYCVERKTLFSGDAFGCFGALNGGVTDEQICVDAYWDEMVRYYANIAGKYGPPIQTALQKLATVPIDALCSTHGPVWKKNIARVIDIYDKLSTHRPVAEGVVVVYASMYGHTAQMAEAVAQGISEAGERNVLVYDASRTDASYLLRDIFKYNALVVGSPTYNNNLYPEIAALLQKIESRGLKNRRFGYFGSFTWSGAAVKRLAQFADTMQWTKVEPIEMKMSMNADVEAACRELGHRMVTNNCKI